MPQLQIRVSDAYTIAGVGHRDVHYAFPSENKRREVAVPENDEALIIETKSRGKRLLLVASRSFVNCL